jgi:hypothetical protein
MTSRGLSWFADRTFFNRAASLTIDPAQKTRKWLLARQTRALFRHLLTATSGLALLWVGWFLSVFFVVLWLLRTDGDPTRMENYSIMLVITLGQGAIVTGMGLAVIETLRARHQRYQSPHQASSINPRRDHSVADAEPDQNLGFSQASLGIEARRDTNVRAALLHPDGSIEVETLLGRRRFESVDDALRFIGTNTTRGASGERDGPHTFATAH